MALRIAGFSTSTGTATAPGMRIVRDLEVRWKRFQAIRRDKVTVRYWPFGRKQIVEARDGRVEDCQGGKMECVHLQWPCGRTVKAPETWPSGFYAPVPVHHTDSIYLWQPRIFGKDRDATRHPDLKLMRARA